MTRTRAIARSRRLVGRPAVSAKGPLLRPFESVEDAEEDMDLAVSDVDTARGADHVLVLECGRPVEACTEIGSKLKFSANASADQGLMALAIGGRCRIAVVAAGAAYIDERAQGEVPVRAAVDLLRGDTEIANQRQV